MPIGSDFDGTSVTLKVNVSLPGGPKALAPGFKGPASASGASKVASAPPQDEQDSFRAALYCPEVVSRPAGQIDGGTNLLGVTCSGCELQKSV